MADDAQELIIERNNFYRQKYRTLLGAFSLGLFAIVALGLMIHYQLTHQSIPVYFATDEVGKIIQDTPVGQPNMSQQDLAAWVSEAIEAAYSYDFVNYRQELQNAQKYFTEYGWRNYMDALNANNNILALTERKFIVIAKVSGPVKLITAGLLGASGRYAWKFEVPVLVTYQQPSLSGGAPAQFQNALKVTILVQRMSILESYKGLGILQVITELVTTPGAAPAAG